LLAADREVIDSGRSLAVPSQAFRTHDGREMVLHMVREPVTFEGRPAVMVTAMDVTDVHTMASGRRRFDQGVADAQRLEGLGLLASGVAHDFNNLLVGVLANTELALYDTPSERTKMLLDRVKVAANRLAGLTRQLLSYAGRGRVSIEPVALTGLVRETLDLLSGTVSPRIRFESSLPSDLPAINADRAQLTQVIMNLVINAAEALGDREGTIHVAVRSERVDSSRTASLSVRSVHGAMDFVCLEVKDDGPGMDEATRNRIFDPFFTTKGKAGRGLGLASVIGIVRAHQGALQVDSAPGAGTSMRVWFPPVHERLRVERATARVEPLIAQGRRVLIVDDEAIVREATSAVLEARGFTVHAAADGTAALAMLKLVGDVDAVLLDMTMPGAPIANVHASIRTALPEAPILLTSGYGEPEALPGLLEEPRTLFIEKPFSADELYGRLQQIFG
jgi:signal transduction histidine kinase